MEGNETASVRQDITPPHLVDCVGGVPCAGHATQPALVLSATIEPDDRSGEHLLRRRHRAIIGPPPFHAPRIDSISVIIVAGGADCVMVASRTVVAKQRLQ